MTAADELVALGFARSAVERAGGAAAAAPAEALLRAIPFEFDALPLVVEGESKIVRAWTDHVVVERFKPTVYSFTHNRYGTAAGTDLLRARFTAEIFRRMNALPPGGAVPRTAFLALIDRPDGVYVVQRRVETCNLEVRVKRYHIGSPLHRYRFTEAHASTQGAGPIRRWSRFERPVVCFDWRHPLTDTDGRRLADEPVSDDYAAMWMDDVPHAREMARTAFHWLEELFAGRGLVLVDLCFFVDRTGHWLFGEISPDAMRVRRLDPGQALDDADALDKDLWRDGRSADDLRARYQELHDRLFR